MKGGKPIYAKAGKVKKKRADIENKKFLAISISPNGLQQDRCATQVKVPYFFKVSIRSNDVGTVEVVSKKPFPKTWNVESYTPITLQFTNKCPKCHIIGTPRVDKKDNRDHTHYRSDYDRLQHRLIYFHNHKDNKTTSCIIANFDKKHGGIITARGTVSKRIVDYTFPNYIIKDD